MTPTATGSSTTAVGDPRGLANQGWKDSWDGITRADGTLPTAPLALVEVQGYVYAALQGAADPGGRRRHRPPAPPTCVGVRRRSRTGSTRPSGTARGCFVLGLDADGRPIDSLTTNPGHALWSGIADEDKARRYVERLRRPGPLDRLGPAHPRAVDGGATTRSATTTAPSGRTTPPCASRAQPATGAGTPSTCSSTVPSRPPATSRAARPSCSPGVARDDVAMPVAYPSSCSPQAWASASVLLLVRDDARSRADGRPVPASSWCEPTCPGYRTSPWSASSSPVTPRRSPCTTAEARSRRLTLRSGLITAMLAVNWTSMTSAPGIEFDSVRRSSRPAPQHRRRALWQSRKANRQRAQHRRNTAHRSVGHLRVPPTRPVKRLVTARQTATAGGEPDRSICVRVDLCGGVSERRWWRALVCDRLRR